MTATLSPTVLDRTRGALLGLAAGDAVGTTVEFSRRGEFAPLTDMVGGGPFRLAPGQWTDDTSMALCLASSLVEVGRFDALDQMKRYLRWLDEGYMSSTGSCFDIGVTVSGALSRFREDRKPVAGSEDPTTAGNGSIMRLAPVPIAYFPDIDDAEYFAEKSSRTTHGAEESVDACRLLARMIVRALRGDPKDAILLGDERSFFGAEAIERIAQGAYLGAPESKIEGTGYVVRSLEAALWCFDETESFRDAILMAANLGDDADSTAAVCGQIAGAYYGLAGIPAEWVERIAMRDEILSLADRLASMTPEDAGASGGG